MDVLNHIKKRFNLPDKIKSPYEIEGLTRESLYDVFAELNYKVGAEIGVYRGANANEICNRIPFVYLWGVDFYQGYSRKRTDRTQRHFLRVAKRTLKEHIEMGRFRFLRKDSVKAASIFEDGYFDFVYIDANHNFDFVMRDIIEWSRKVRKGGIVSGHDYFRNEKLKGVCVAVDAYVKAHRIKPWFVTSEGRKRSFFWVKE